MRVLKIGADEWARHSEAAHRAVFAAIKPANWDRISYALLAINDNDDPVIYVTVRENDPESVYWQFGGAFPPFRNTPQPIRAFAAFIKYQAKLSKRVSCFVENTNLPMLKMALAHGFLIIGTRTYGGSIFLDLIKELK